MNEMITVGIQLMATGMAIVFAFLALLVFAVNWLSFVVQRFFPDKPTSQNVIPVKAAGDNTQIIAAITAAVLQYRNKYRT